jgi:hypothetical protein
VADRLALAQAQNRVLTLRAVYDEAVANSKAAWQQLRGLELPNPAGQQNYGNALEAEIAALQAYLQSVRDMAALAQYTNSRQTHA